MRFMQFMHLCILHKLHKVNNQRFKSLDTLLWVIPHSLAMSCCFMPCEDNSLTLDFSSSRPLVPVVSRWAASVS